MSRNPSHKWLLNVLPSAQRSFDRFSPANKRTTFHHLQQLLEAEVPYMLPFVIMLKEKSFERIRRFRVGDYRVTFYIEAGEITIQSHTYKGILHMISITDRKESYRD